MYEEEIRKAKKYENDSQEVKRKIDELIKKTEDQSSYIASLKNEINNLNELKSAHEEKIDDLLHQIRNLSNENEHFKYTVQSFDKERNDYNRRIKELNEELSQESQKIIDAVAAARREENEKLENEINERNKLQTKLTQAEARARHLSNEMSEKDKKIVELRNATTRLENFINELQAKCLNLESDLAHKENVNRDLQKKIERNQVKTQEGLAKVRKFLSLKLSNLRSDITSISNAHALEIEMNRKSIQGIVTELVRHFREKMQAQETRALEEKEQALEKIHEDLQIKLKELEVARLEEKMKEQAAHERVVKEHIEENENLQREINHLREELDTRTAQLDEANQANLTNRIRLEKLENENANLRQVNQEKVEEFERLQNYVQKELKRIKEESQSVMSDSILQIEEQHEKNLKSLFQVIEQLKESNIVRLRKFEEEISKLQNVYLTDLNQLKNMYEGKLLDYEKELNVVDNELRTKKREITNLRNELESLRETYAKLREENQKTFLAFEEKIETFKEMMKSDSDKYMSYRTQSNQEIERLKREIREMQREITEKNKKIEDLGKIKDDLRNELERYRGLLLQKDKTIETQQKENLKVTKHREREIEELQNLLNKSMQSFGVGSKSSRDKTINIVDYEK